MPIKFGNDSNLFDMSNPVGYTGSYPNIVENSSGVSSKWYEVSEVAKENAITVVSNPKENSTSVVFGFVTSNDMETLELRAGIFNTAAATINEDNTYVLLRNSAHFKNMLNYKYVRFYYINYNKINHAGVYIGNLPDQKFIPYSGGGAIASVKFGTTEISKIYRGSELVYQKSRLPDEYHELEYIESTGTQRIDTGLTVLVGARWYSELDLQYTEATSASQVAIATSADNGSWFGQNGSMYSIGGSDGKFEASTNRVVAYGTWGNAPETTINGVRRFYLNTINTQGGKVYLFANNDNAPFFSKMKLYGAKIYNADHKLIRDFVPAERMSDGMTGLYDIVNDVFYMDEKGGDFLARRIVPKTYTASEYLQSSGTQYIDTGVIANQDTKLTMDIEFLNEINEESPFGAYESSSKFVWNFSLRTYSYPMFGSIRDTIEHSLVVNRKYALEMGQNGAYLNGNQVKTYPAQTFQMTGSINLFRRNPISGTTNPRMSIIKMYDCNIYQADKLIHEYLPAVRNSDSVAGLYDALTNTFLTNVGTGDFDTTVAVASGKSIEFDTSSKSLSGWQVKGDTEQDGTPTPTAPVEVKTVTGSNVVSVVGKNLFDGGNYEWSKNYLTATGTWGSNTSMMTDTYIEVLPDTDYIISWSNGTLTDAIGWSGFPMYNQYRADKSVIGRDLGRGYRKANEYISFRTEPDCKYVRFAFYTMSKSGSQVTVDLDNHSYSDYITNIQLEKGSTATSYEAYSGQEVEVNLGKNLADINYSFKPLSFETTYTGITNGFTITRTTNTGYVGIWVDKNAISEKEVTISWNSSSASSKVRFYRNDTAGGGITWLFGGKYFDNGETLTMPNLSPYAEVFMIFYVNSFSAGVSETTVTYTDIQLERGDKASSYAPYINHIGKNIIDLNGFVKGRLDNGNVGYAGGTSSMSVSGDSITFTTTDNYRGIVSSPTKVEPNTAYRLSVGSSLSGVYYFFDEYDADMVWIGRNSGVSSVFNTSSECRFIRISYQIQNAGTVTISSIQLEKGSEASPYEPFIKPELCKLGDYQDRIFKAGDSWKIEKHINAKTIKSNWMTDDFGGRKRIYAFTSALGMSGTEANIKPDSNAEKAYILHSSFTNVPATDLLNTQKTCFCISTSNVISFRKQDATSAVEIANIVNGSTLYYALATPYTATITYQPLIDQLNELERLKAKIGYNLVETSGSVLAPYIEFKYKKQ